MARTTPPLTAQERVILFCTATGVGHAADGITAHAMQSMAIKGHIRVALVGFVLAAARAFCSDTRLNNSKQHRCTGRRDSRGTVRRRSFDRYIARLQATKAVRTQVS
jgi:hypothetical protein